MGGSGLVYTFIEIVIEFETLSGLNTNALSNSKSTLSHLAYHASSF